MTESETGGFVAGTKPLLPQQTVQETPHEMSYLTKATIQAAVTREQESANPNWVFPQAIRDCAVKRIFSATLSGGRQRRRRIDSPGGFKHIYPQGDAAPIGRRLCLADQGPNDADDGATRA